MLDWEGASFRFLESSTPPPRGVRLIPRFGVLPYQVRQDSNVHSLTYRMTKFGVVAHMGETCFLESDTPFYVAQMCRAVCQRQLNFLFFCKLSKYFVILTNNIFTDTKPFSSARHAKAIVPLNPENV